MALSTTYAMHPGKKRKIRAILRFKDIQLLEQQITDLKPADFRVLFNLWFKTPVYNLI